MDEVALYNFHAAAGAGRAAAEKAQNLALVLMIKHLRLEHGMHLNAIAKRCNLKVKQVKNILGESE